MTAKQRKAMYLRERRRAYGSWPNWSGKRAHRHTDWMTWTQLVRDFITSERR